MTEFRQRWRIVFGRPPGAISLVQRELTERWQAGLEAVGLSTASSPARLAVAAPLPTGMAAERELADLYVAGRLPVADVRERLVRSMPPGLELRDVHDVWLGEPALAGLVVGAEYLVGLAGADDGDRDRLDAGARRLEAASSIPRRREKGGHFVDYDLRPLLASVTVVHPPEPSQPEIGDLALDVCVRHDPERGVGRPEEVVAALADASGLPLVIGSIARRRLLLADDLPRTQAAAPPRRRPVPAAGGGGTRLPEAPRK